MRRGYPACKKTLREVITYYKIEFRIGTVMYPIPGHLAMSLAGSRLCNLPYLPAIAATFMVDLFDKALADGFAVVPYGRCWFHTLLSVAVCSFVVGKFAGKSWGWSWAVGHFLHLISDIGFIPWFYPIIPYHWPEAPNVSAAALQGLEETLMGMHYSAAVLAVFRGKLLAIELALLLSACALLPQQPKYKKHAFAASTLIFFAILSARVAYDFPWVINRACALLGDWIRV